MTHKERNKIYYEKNRNRILEERRIKRARKPQSDAHVDHQKENMMTTENDNIISNVRYLHSSQSDAQSDGQSDGRMIGRSDGQQRAAEIILTPPDRPNLLIPFLVIILGAIICELIYLQYDFMSQNGAPGLANLAIAMTIELIPIALMFCRCDSWALNLIRKGIALACVILTLGVTSISVLDHSKSKSSGIAYQKKQEEIDRLAMEEQQRASTQARELEMRGLSQEIESQQALLESAMKDKAWGVMKMASINISNANMRMSDLRKTLQTQPEIIKNQPTIVHGDEKLAEVSGWVLVGIRALLLISSLFFASYIRSIFKIENRIFD